MPQMSPLWWTTLMLIFIVLFLMVMIMLYFNFSNLMTKKISLVNNKINWKW